MAITIGSLATQKNVVAHSDRSMVFFQSQSLAYNWKTNQWSLLSHVDGSSFYQRIDPDEVLGYFYPSGQSYEPRNFVRSYGVGSAPSAATATVITGEIDLNAGGRAIVDAARPLHDGASLSSVRIGIRDLPSDSVTWCTGTALNSRTGQSNFRSAATPPEGRYHRAEFVFTGGFTTVSGAEFEFYPQGKV